MIELNMTDLQEVNGGGPIADLVEAVLCGTYNFFKDHHEPGDPWPFYG